MNQIDRWMGVAASAVFVAAGSLVTAGQAVADPCPDVQVVFARGTFEPAGVGTVGRAFVDSVRAKAPGKSVDEYAVNYPASLDFATAADGVIDASNKVRATTAACPNTKIVLGGYSQGAAVAAYITADAVPQGFALPPGLSGPMPADVADKVAAVALFGKPSSGFLQMIYTGAPPITVGSRYVGKTDDICIEEDPVCSPTGRDQAAHGTYIDRGLTDQAAGYVVSRLGSQRSVQPVDQTAAHR
ncbi:cutinase family protein [Mycobacterium sp. BMJ-28]